MPVEKYTYRMICWKERIDHYGKSIARFAWDHKGSLLLVAGLATLWAASRDEGPSLFDRQFSAKLYDPYPKGRHEGELALYMFEKSDIPGQKKATGLLVNVSEKHAFRINYIRGELVPLQGLGHREQ